MAKQMAFDVEARDRLRAGVEKISRAVGSTLGPKGRNAILDKSWGGPSITKDGVTVADEIELEDPYENMAAQLVREAATRTNKDAGDGTTTATVLAKALTDEGLKLLAAGAHGDGLLRGIKKAVDAAVAEIGKRSRKINAGDRKQLEQIATISANGDTTIGKTLADALAKVGADGVITIEEGKGLETQVNVVEGMQFDRGFLSAHFVTNVDRLECVFEKPLILIHQEKISAVKTLIPLLEMVSKAGRPLLIIAEDIEGEALATLVVNKLRGIVNVCAVKAPGYGDRRKSMLGDIAALTGGTVIAPDLDLEKVKAGQLGTARKVIVTAENCTIVQGGGKAADVSARIKNIRHEIEATTSDYDKEKLQERLAKLAGGIAEIRVGAATETELKERKARFEDSHHATRAALAEGILPGGGVALLRARPAVETLAKSLEGDEQLGAQVVSRALELPLRIIAKNAGYEPGLVVRKVLSTKASEGFDALRGEYVDMVEAGIIDPAKVVRCALQNASSVAALLLSTDCLIADIPEKKDDDHAGHQHGGGPMGGMDF